MTTLNEFHLLNWQRMSSGVFGPPHDGKELCACVIEEVGELASAVLGVTGKKKRKANKTHEDVLDAVADAQTYVSLLISATGEDDLEGLLGNYPTGDAGDTDLITRLLYVNQNVGRITWEVLYPRANSAEVKALSAFAFHRLVDVARAVGCEDWQRLLFQTFNRVSQRSGSLITVEA